MTDPSGPSLDEVLDDRDMGYRTLARKLLGPGASPREIDNKRRQVRAWAEKDTWSDATAKQLSAALGLPSGYFKRQRRRQDKLPTHRELAARLALAEGEIAHLRGWVRLGFEAVGLAPELEDEAPPVPASPALQRRRASPDATSP